ncbi:MAG: MarR family winged helix-turn-helix transcriptional regulator [Jatrophihabitantaceae bacterium]
MGPPPDEPIGLQLARTAKAVSRAFEGALAEVGGSLASWLILLSLKSEQHGAQHQIAAAVGVEGPTLTHHLNRLEREGLVSRTRDPDNRRVQRVRLTEAGDAAFQRMVGAARAFDQRLRAGLNSQQLTAFERVLGQLRENLQLPTGELR